MLEIILLFGLAFTIVCSNSSENDVRKYDDGSAGLIEAIIEEQEDMRRLKDKYETTDPEEWQRICLQHGEMVATRSERVEAGLRAKRQQQCID